MEYEYYVEKVWDWYIVFEQLDEHSDEIAKFTRLEDAEMFVREKEKKEA